MVSLSGRLDRSVRCARTEGQARPTWDMERQWRQSKSHPMVKQYDEFSEENSMNEYKQLHGLRPS